MTTLSELKLPKYNTRATTGVIPFSSFGESLYDSELDWISGSAWEDVVTDDMITNFLCNVNVSLFGKMTDVKRRGWRQSKHHPYQRSVHNPYQYTIDFGDDHDRWIWFHTERVALIAYAISNGNFVKPAIVGFDNDEGEFSIFDGNHRVKALQYLGYDGFPSVVYGFDKLDDFDVRFDDVLSESVERGYLIPRVRKDKSIYYRKDVY